MQMHKLDSLEQIINRVCGLQRAQVTLQEQYKNSQNTFECHIEDSARAIIDILDMIEVTTVNMNLDDVACANAKRIIQKIEKRLVSVLQSWQVKEIVFQDSIIEPGKARVMETRHVSEIPVGSIIEVCRKGYQRYDKIIRATDVITAE